MAPRARAFIWIAALAASLAATTRAETTSPTANGTTTPGATSSTERVRWSSTRSAASWRASLETRRRAIALFVTWIRSYVKNFTYKPAETRRLVAILNQITRKDWQPWFERFVYGTETPEVK